MKYSVEMGSKCHDIRDEFLKDWFMNSEIESKVVLYTFSLSEFRVTVPRQ
jgi:hypothetical protein